jgi:predicted phosphodiesterase
LSEAKHPSSVYVALAEEGLNNYQIAERLGVGEASVRRGLRKVKYTRSLKPITIKTDDFLDSPLRHYGPCAVTADWHIPLVDYQFASKFLAEADERNVKTLIIAGDFFNMDSLSSFDYKQSSANLETEISQANEIMVQLCHQFDKIYFLWGNHDARLWKALNYQLTFSQCMKLAFADISEELLSKIHFTNLDHMWVNDQIYICHPKNYTQVPLATARKLAGKVHAHVITAHSHHAAMGYDVSGRYICVEAGGLFDTSKTEYLQRTTTFPNWRQGFSFIEEDGRISMHTPDWSVR